MNWRRFRWIAAMDLRFHLRRPLLWVLLIALGFVSFGLASGNLTIQSGDSTIGGGAKAWVTSEFTTAMMFPLVTFLFYSFFIAIAAGMAVPRDDELRVGPVLHSTPLRAREYVWGKFTAVLLAFALVLVLHLLMAIFFNQFFPNANADQIRGPFAAINYLRPAFLLAAPFLLFLCGVSFAVGEWTRKPILVFVAPLALFLVSLFFLWDWSPSWLDPNVNRFLMWIEPSGFRWVNETWLKVDLGVDYYNHQSVGYDGPFLLSRLVYAALGLVGVASAERHFARTLRGRKAAEAPWWWRRKTRVGAPTSPVRTVGSLASLSMTSRAPSFLRTVLEVARSEARNLRGQPGLYLFVPLILLQTIGDNFSLVGAFDTPVLLTPGIAATQAMNTLSLLVCLLLLFYTAESVSREWTVGLAPLFYSTPTQTAALLTGKAISGAIVAVVIVLSSYLGAAVVMLFEGKVTPAVGPFLLVWGLLLLPTFLAWAAFVMACLALTGSRYATYALGIAAMAFTGWRQTNGEMNWVGNWNLWSSTTWTDLGGLQPNSQALLLNRLFWLAVTACLLALSVRFFRRRSPDSGRILDRLRPQSLLRAGLRFAPVLLPTLALGSVLYWQVEQGFQGGQSERREEDYHRRNLLTWNGAPTPDLVDVDLDLELEPTAGTFRVKGRYRLENKEGQPLRRFPLSVGDHFEDLAWTLDGQPFEPEDWARMAVFELEEPLAVGDRVEVGFSHHGRLPRGITKNGGGLGQFILPAGVVLTSFESNFVPVPFFEEERGVDEDNRLEARSWEEGHWEGPTRPGIESGGRFSVRTRITGPAEYQYNGVGRRESETVEDGRRSVVWQTDYPVNFFNVVAGRWETWKGEGVEVYYHPGHPYNIEEIGKALEASRRHYSEWFYPYPWEELKLSEFAGIASYAQGFPTNITFSERLGFLTRSRPDSRIAFLVTAHEAAHQWWGNLLLPGEGPGGNILSEGMAHFSTLLLTEEVQGPRERIEFCRRIEERYGENRRVDAERPLVWTDDSKTGDTTVTYDKGGFVFWMLLQHLGRERGLAAIQDFIGHYVHDDSDYPLLQDFLRRVRPYAEDEVAFDAFVDQWFFDVVVPEYRLLDVEVMPGENAWRLTARVQNVGTGRMPIEIAATRGERFPDPEAVDTDRGSEGWREGRVSVELGAGEAQSIAISLPFAPERLIVDPDAKVLMLRRERAEVDLDGAFSDAS